MPALLGKGCRVFHWRKSLEKQHFKGVCRLKEISSGANIRTFCRSITQTLVISTSAGLILHGSLSFFICFCASYEMCLFLLSWSQLQGLIPSLHLGPGLSISSCSFYGVSELRQISSIPI